MNEGSQYNRFNEECPYSWLNEWLCEYVDGTMDPSLRNNFEEYLEANPDLAEHVECLKRTRELLCDQSSGGGIPQPLKHKLTEEPECCGGDEEQAGAWREHVRSVAGMAAMFVVGVAVGAVFLGNEHSLAPGQQATSAATSQSSVGQESEAPTRVENEEPFAPSSSGPFQMAPATVTPSATPLFSPQLAFPPTIVDTTVAPATHLSDSR